MAPVVCMTDFPMPRTDAAYPHTRRRQRNHRLAVGFVEKYRTLETRQMSIVRDISRLVSPHPRIQSSACISETSSHPNYLNNNQGTSFATRTPIEKEEQWITLKRRAGLLNILARTLDLIRRNHILEKKVEALRLETRSFMKSTLANPDNSDKSTSMDEDSRSSSKTNDSMSSTEEESSCLKSVTKDEQLEETSRTSDERFEDHSSNSTVH